MAGVNVVGLEFTEDDSKLHRLYCVWLFTV